MSKKLWGGRFEKETNPLLEKFSKSIQYDYKLGQCDVIGSVIHVIILEKSGYLSKQEAVALREGLMEIHGEIKNGSFRWSEKYEDIHTQIQNVLQDKVKDVALKLHTARSRNDQVVFATKIYCKNMLRETEDSINGLILKINELIEENREIIIPGFTHMQHAQPVYLKDYFQAYVEMLKRDKNRLKYIDKHLIITFGAGALAGTPIACEKYGVSAQEVLEIFGKITDDFQIESTMNSLDAVSDRDFVIEIISALAIIAMHLSRLSEDLIIWSTKEFDFIEIDEAFCTGSSLMPQKKNPDALELIRGYAGRISGNLVSVLMMMKGLPLTYNRDMQLDKEPLFNSFEIISDELKILAGLIRTLKFNKGKIEEHLKDEALYATDLVYYLVDPARGVPFKTAHTIVGELIKYSLDTGIDIKEMPESKLKEFCDKFVKSEVVGLFNPKVSVESKKSIKRE